MVHTRVCQPQHYCHWGPDISLLWRQFCVFSSIFLGCHHKTLWTALLKNRNLFLEVLEVQDQGQSPAIVFIEGAPPGVQTAISSLSPRGLSSECEERDSKLSDVSSSKGTNLIRPGPHPHDSSKAKPKSSHPNTVTLEVRASTYEFQRGPHSVLCRQSCGMFSSIPGIYTYVMHSFSLKRWQRMLEGCSDSYDIPSPVFATYSLEDISPDVENPHV